MPEEITQLIINSENELLKVLLIEEYDINRNELLKKSCIENAKSWIFLYHLFLRDFITKDEFKLKSKIIHNLSFYTALKRSGFGFYKPICSAPARKNYE